MASSAGVVMVGGWCSFILQGAGVVLDGWNCRGSRRVWWWSVGGAPGVVGGGVSGHICGGTRGRCVARPRSVAAAFACESGTLFLHLALIFTLLGILFANATTATAVGREVFTRFFEVSRKDFPKSLRIVSRKIRILTRVRESCKQ